MGSVLYSSSQFFFVLLLFCFLTLILTILSLKNTVRFLFSSYISFTYNFCFSYTLVQSERIHLLCDSFSSIFSTLKTLKHTIFFNLRLVVFISSPVHSRVYVIFRFFAFNATGFLFISLYHRRRFYFFFFFLLFILSSFSIQCLFC